MHLKQWCELCLSPGLDGKEGGVSFQGVGVSEGGEGLIPAGMQELIPPGKALPGSLGGEFAAAH